jgi:hypothetical protein
MTTLRFCAAVVAALLTGLGIGPAAVQAKYPLASQPFRG